MAAKGKILIVDDEPANLLALRAVLDDMGHEIVSAGSGREALRCLMNDDFSMILMDVQMPTMDGFETALLIRSRERSRSTPIVFLTAVGRSENEMFRGYEVGAVDYMVKPFVPGILRYKVTVLMDLQAKTAELTAANQGLLTLNASLEERVRQRTLELEQQGKLLEQSNEALSQFASLASHDLQEPLRSMSTYLYLLERSLGGALPAEARGHMESATLAAARMKDLVSGLLAFSRLEDRAHEPVPVDCSKVLTEVLNTFKACIAEKGAQVTAGVLPVVLGDPVMIRHLLQNLLSNAFKFTDGKPPQVEVGAERKGTQALLWVRDHGIGIAPEHFDSIFKLFKRLHGVEEFPGSGLGLSLCKKIVERHGGALWLESEPGQGSTFYFTLPFEAQHGSASSERIEALRGGGGGGLPQ